MWHNFHYYNTLTTITLHVLVKLQFLLWVLLSISSSYDQMVTQSDPSLGDIMVAATIFYISLYSVLYFFKKFFVIYFLF